MLLIIGVLIATGIVTVLRLVVPAGVQSADLGWMSEQWVAEHRATHPS